MVRFLFWLLWHVPLGRLAPWVMGLALGRWPHHVSSHTEGEQHGPQD